MYTVLRCR